MQGQKVCKLLKYFRGTKSSSLGFFDFVTESKVFCHYLVIYGYNDGKGTIPFASYTSAYIAPSPLFLMC